MANIARIIHLADIHIRDSDRDKFTRALDAFGEIQSRTPRVTPTIAIIAGDVFHYKTKLSAENIQDCFALFDAIAAHVDEIIVIPGNHDANLNNGDRVDLLTAVVENARVLAHGKRIRYISHSGWITSQCAPNLAIHIFSPLSAAAAAADAPPQRAAARIAVLHDFIDGMRLAGNVMRSQIRGEWLRPFNAVLCGHVHDYTQVSGNIVYCGAFTQLTVGETYNKGYVQWEISPAGIASHRFIPLRISAALVKYVISQDSRGPHYSQNGEGVITDPARVVIELRSSVDIDAPRTKAMIEELRRATPCAQFDIITPAATTSAGVARAIGTHRSDRSVATDIVIEKLRAANPLIDEITIQRVIEFHTNAMKQSCAAPGGTSWRPIYLEWSDLLCYGPGNNIRFDSLSGIAGLIAPNRCGKSSIIDILVLALFNETLRGSAYNIIRRGSREGHLFCVWETENGAHKHELSRKWDVKGHTTLQYIVDGVNKTEVEMKQTYATIARGIGTLDDFLAAALIPQHSDSSFIDATDAQKRAILARILGFDMLDGAIAYTHEREREYTAQLKLLEAQSDAALARMKNAMTTKVAYTAQMEGGDDITRDDVAIKYRQLLSELDEEIARGRAELTDLEAQPAAAAPTRSVVDIEGDINALSAKIVSMEIEINERESNISARRSAIGSTSTPEQQRVEYESLSAATAAAHASINHEALSLGRAQRETIDNIQRRIDEARTRQSELAAVHSRLLEALEIPFDDPREPRDSDVSESITEIEAAIINEKRKLPANPLMKCACGNDEKRAAHLRSIKSEMECAHFAQNVDIPPNIPRGIDDARRAMIEANSAMDDTSADAPRSRADCALVIAYCALRIARAIAPEFATRETSSDLRDARICYANHDAVMRNCETQAKIQRLESRLRAARDRRRAELLAPNAAAKTHDAVRSLLRENEQAMFQCERALALFHELREKAPLIRTALAQYAEASAMQTKLEALTATRRLQIQLEEAVAICSKRRAEHSTALANLADLRASIETCRRAEREFAEHQQRQRKIKKLREIINSAQSSRMSIAAEAAEYSAVRVSWRDIGNKRRALHESAHICKIYREALDAKTGVQFHLLSNALRIIIEEVNRILAPISGLTINIAQGNTKVVTTISPSTSTPSQRGAMQIIVRDEVRGLEHNAELCSGFQRFILNIAIRRAFMKCAVRPMPRFMIIDEGFGCIDEPNLIKVCEHLPDLARELDFTLIVSHTDALNALITMPLVINVPPARAGAASTISFGEKIARSIVMVPEHAARARAKRATASQSAAELPGPMIVDVRADGTKFCKICNKDVKVWARHAKSVKHMKKMQMMTPPPK